MSLLNDLILWPVSLRHQHTACHGSGGEHVAKCAGLQVEYELHFTRWWEHFLKIRLRLNWKIEVICLKDTSQIHYTWCFFQPKHKVPSLILHPLFWKVSLMLLLFIDYKTSSGCKRQIWLDFISLEKLSLPTGSENWYQAFHLYVRQDLT